MGAHTEVVQAFSPEPGRRLLLVEDEESLRTPLARGLRKCGHTVMEAESGSHALEVVRQLRGPIDLIITDIVMPGMNGEDLVKWLRIKQPRLKVLYVSGHDEDQLVRYGLLKPGETLLIKPFTIPELIATVSELLKTTLS